MTTVDAFDAKAFVSRRMSDALVRVEGVEVRQYPEESIVVVRVAKDDFERAIGLANDVDRELASRGFAGFVTIKSSQSAGGPARAPGQAGGLRGQRVVQFVNVLTARSRTSEIQPSLSYVPDAQNNIATATTPRHHLIGIRLDRIRVARTRLIERGTHVADRDAGRPHAGGSHAGSHFVRRRRPGRFTGRRTPASGYPGPRSPTGGARLPGPALPDRAGLAG